MTVVLIIIFFQLLGVATLPRLLMNQSLHSHENQTNAIDMTKWRLYAWGANSHGQLGLGYQSELSALPCEVDLSATRLDPGTIEKIVGGGGHSLILDRKGRVYSCGWNDRGQTGHDVDGDKVVLNFRRVEVLRNERMKDIACGWNGTMALSEEGEVWAWGSDSHGQLGSGADAGANYEAPRKIRGLDERIKAIAMGLRHSAIVTESGRVLVSGSGSRGQLGILDEGRAITKARTFAKIPTLEDVAEVACGQNHTAAMTRSGETFTWGDNRHGQLGVDSSKARRMNHPTKVMSERKGESRLRVGWTHTSVLREDGTIVAWGRNNYGQLGHAGSEKNVTWMAKEIASCPKFCQLAVGSEHNVGIGEDRSVYAWGWNEHGNCGDGSTRDVSEPKRVFYPHNGEAILVGSGAGHSFALIATEFSTDSG